MHGQTTLTKIHQSYLKTKSYKTFLMTRRISSDLNFKISETSVSIIILRTAIYSHKQETMSAANHSTLHNHINCKWDGVVIPADKFCRDKIICSWASYGKFDIAFRRFSSNSVPKNIAFRRLSPNLTQNNIAFRRFSPNLVHNNIAFRRLSSNSA